MDRLTRIAAFAVCLMFLPACAGTPKKREAAAPTKSTGYAERADVQAWIPDAAQRTGVPSEYIATVLRRARYSGAVARAILPTSTTVKRSWRAYQARFLEPIRLEAGERFWRDHSDTLERAQSLYGVPAEVIVAIVGIETLYGKYTGDFRAIDVFATLGFDWPAQAPRDRSEFFRNELQELMVFSREHGIDPVSVKGSYAGAIGLPQFMPSSLRRYAVDFDGDGIVDLRSSPADAIGSVANFLVAHGWQRDAPIWFDATLDHGDPQALIANDLEASSTLEVLSEAGITCAAPNDGASRFGLVDLTTPDEPTTWKCAAPNFFSITRYNRSFFYAAAVTEFSQALRAAHTRP